MTAAKTLLKSIGRVALEENDPDALKTLAEAYALVTWGKEGGVEDAHATTHVGEDRKKPAGFRG